MKIYYELVKYYKNKYKIIDENKIENVASISCDIIELFLENYSDS